MMYRNQEDTKALAVCFIRWHACAVSYRLTCIGRIVRMIGALQQRAYHSAGRCALFSKTIIAPVQFCVTLFTQDRFLQERLAGDPRPCVGACLHATTRTTSRPDAEPPMTSAEKQGLIAGLLAVACWSGFVLVSRLGGTAALMPLDTMALRVLVGASLLSAFARGRLWWNARGFWRALVGGIGYCLFVYQGFRYTSAVHAAVMLPGLIPFGAALFSA